MDYKNIKKVTILGIGGKGAYYIAKFLNIMGVEIIGYDLKESKNTKIASEVQFRLSGCSSCR